MAVSVALAGGGSVIAWQTSEGVFFELFNANLDPVGPPVTVAGGSTAWLSAAPLGDGGFSIVWDTSAGDSPLVQDYDASGVPVGAPYVGVDPPGAAVAFTSLADTFTTSATSDTIATVTLADGSEVSATFGPDGNRYAEQIQHFDSSGNAIGAAFVDYAAQTSAFDDNKIAALVDGGYAVSYLLQSSWTSTLDVERFAADGTHLGTIQVASLDFAGDFTYYPEILEQSIAGLPDGGFVVSWTAENNAPPQVFSEEFNAASQPIGSATLLGASIDTSSGYATPEIDVLPDGLYTVSWASPTGQQSASFTEQGTPVAPPANSDAIETAAASYTLPVGPHQAVMIGDAAQTVIGNNLGDTITANDAAATLIGGSGNDTLIAGHGADVMTGGGGDDSFVFNYLPWNAGQITDFNVATDQLDLGGIFNAIGYTGSNPVGDGYLILQSDGNGDTQVYINSHNPSDPWPTLVTTLDGVSPSSITPQDYGFSSLQSSSGSDSSGDGDSTTVDTAAANYTAAAGVLDVVMTATTAQTIAANNLGDTITANDAVSTIIGGTGNDTLIAGHNADTLTGGGGEDTFVFNDLPWNAGQITDFNPAADILDLSGIFHAIGYAGSDPVADGYLNFVSDNAGDTKVYVAPQGPGTAIPILVTTLDHVAPSALHHGDWVFA